MFENADIRGEIIHLDAVLKKIYDNHDYPITIKELLTEVLLCTILMSSTLKYEGQLTLQFQSKSALSLLLVKCNNLFEVRALAQFDKDVEPSEYYKSITEGSLVVTIESNKLVKLLSSCSRWSLIDSTLKFKSGSSISIFFVSIY